jgi:predicted neuraminidase
MNLVRQSVCSLLALGLATLCWTSAVAAPAPTIVRSSEFIYERASFPQCHASTIVETSSGVLLTAFFGGTHEKNPDVGIWISRHAGGRWTPPVEVANGVQYTKVDGTVVRHPTWNPVLFQPRRGPLMLFYKVGPTPQTWWGMLMTSTDDGRTWSEPRRLPEGVLGPIKNKPIQLADDSILCPTSDESPVTGWTIHFEKTRDLGRSWQFIGPIHTQEEFNAIQPSFLEHKDGRLQILARSKNDVLVTSWSSDSGQTWSRVEATNLANPNSGTDALTLRDGRHILVYNPTKRMPDGQSGPRSPLQVAVSNDGLGWTDIAVLEDDSAQYGYSYPAVIQTRDGLVHVTYTWRRERIKHVVIDPAAVK